MTYNTPNSIWTEERVEQLKALWAAGGLSCNGIATELGGGVSRNAVIGKALRLGLTKKSRGADIRLSKAKQPRAKRTIRKAGNTSYVPRDTDDDQPFEADVSSLANLESQATPVSFLGISFMKLQPNHCRYPRTIDGATLFCGQPKIENSAYCGECHRCCHSHWPAGRQMSEATKEARIRGMRRALAAQGRAA